MPTKLKTILKPQNKSSRARIADLSVLPVFLQLTDKTVLLIGGSEAAAWKAELAAAAGATIVVACCQSEVSEEMAALFARSLTRGQVMHHPMTIWDLSVAGVRYGAAPQVSHALENIDLVIADVAPSDAPECVAMARELGVVINVIDQPEFCDFQFGSIVNRSPVVVGISTSGAAPILGQAVRQKIETLLPLTLSGWAALAEACRGRVMSLLAAGRERRQFWETFSRRAFSGDRADPEQSISQQIGAVLETAHNKTGKVTLVGAGPGDAELLTLKAVRALQAADVILYDNLVGDDVLELARREAKRLCVGKRGGRESCKQEDINDMMVSLARNGKNVVRLKSGDPMVFGRAGEEIAMLESAHIEVAVVPGITAASALASTVPVSLSHRDFGKSVRFVTGHSRDGVLPEDLNMEELAAPESTSVFYMCRRTLPALREKLLSAGMPENTPVILAANISKTNEKIWPTTLYALPDVAASLCDDDITLMAIGNGLALSRSGAKSQDFIAGPARQVAGLAS